MPEASPAAKNLKPVPPKANPLVEIGITILLPALILMQLSGEQRLGPMRALLLALAFPLGWGLWEGLTRRAVSWLAVAGTVNTLLTGAIGLLALDAKWLAVKDAAVPTLIGVVIALSAWTRTPMIRLLVFNNTLFDVPRVDQALQARGTTDAFERNLRRGTLLLACAFFFSAVGHYLLARYLVHSPAGTQAFNEELGRLKLWSYPVIAVPFMAVMMGVMFWLAKAAKKLTGLELADMLQGGA
jgi:hypothetical protein